MVISTYIILLLFYPINRTFPGYTMYFNCVHGSKAQAPRTDLQKEKDPRELKDEKEVKDEMEVTDEKEESKWELTESKKVQESKLK